MHKRFFITPYCLFEGNEVTTGVLMSINTVDERPPVKWISRELMEINPSKLISHIYKSIEVSESEYEIQEENAKRVKSERL